VTSGFRAFHRDAIRLIAENYSEDYPEVEAYVSLAQARFKILEVPVQMRSRQGGVSSIDGIRSTYYVIKVLLSTVINRYRPLRSLEKGEGNPLER
jgi:hypothetical protein